MKLFLQFLSEYGTTILYAILTAVAGYIGIAIKNLYKKYVVSKEKKEVVRTCVKAVEQIYKELHGEEKYQKVVESATEMLNERGIVITEIEIKMLIEAAVAEFNHVFDEDENGVPDYKEV